MAWLVTHTKAVAPITAYAGGRLGWLASRGLLYTSCMRNYVYGLVTTSESATQGHGLHYQGWAAVITTAVIPQTLVGHGWAHMPARSVCLVTLSLPKAGPGRFGRKPSSTDVYHTIL